MNIAFDESGNSGQNLLDPDSPVFTLASCLFTAAQVAELEGLFAGVQAPELKFAKMVGRPRNEARILQFLQSPHVSASTVKIDVVHKRFMAITKYVELILEPSARRAGVDLYRGAANMATANLLNITAPVFLTPPIWDSFLADFLQMAWKRDVASWTKFISDAEQICHRLELTKPDFVTFFAPVVLLKGHFQVFANNALSADELDPIPPSYALLANSWGKQLGQAFIVLADESKALAAHKPTLIKLADPGLKPFEAGFNTRTVQYPLKVSDIRPVASLASREVQLADILAGAACHAIKSSDASKPGTFAANIAATMQAKHLLPHALWPGTQVTPEELGARPDEPGISANEYAARILNNDPTVRK